MKKIAKKLVSLLVSLVTLVSCVTFNSYAVDAEIQTPDTFENNYAATLEEYSKYKVGDIVEFENGMKFVVWSREILLSDVEENSYYINTKYIEYNPNVEIDFTCDNMINAVAASNSGITSYFSDVNTHTYSNTGRTITATILTRFMYDGENAPTVYNADYIFSDSTVMSFKSWDYSSNILTKTATNKLNYQYVAYNALEGANVTYDSSVSVKCKKDGTQG